MSEFTSGNLPGFHAEEESIESQVTWSGRNGQTMIATRRILLDSSVTDPGNSPSTTIRGGQVLALDDLTGRAHLYDPDANNGRQIPVGILEQTQNMLQNGVAKHRFTQMLVHGLLKQSELHGLDARAKQQLAARFVFDQDLTVASGDLMHPRGVYRVGSNHTVAAQENGLLFVATAAVNFTLPAKENGLAFRFLQTADANLAILGSSDIIISGSAAASSVTFSTGGQKIGSHVLVECIYTGTNTLKWLVSNLGATTATVA